MKQHATRRRGVVLTCVGLQRLQAAILASEMAQNNGDRFTLEQLSDRIQISTKTLSRLWSSNVTVDRRTLKMCFSAFDLELRGEDYIISSGFSGAETSETLSTRSDKKETSSYQSIARSYLKEKSLTPEYICSYPDGPVSPDSALYIERPPLEKLAYQEITQPGCVICIRTPRKMGKTSLVLRLLAFAQQQGYHTIKLDFHQIDPLRLSDLNHLGACHLYEMNSDQAGSKQSSATTSPMTPEQEQALKAHLEAIAQILYDESDPEAMKTLEGIEVTVR